MNCGKALRALPKTGVGDGGLHVFYRRVFHVDGFQHGRTGYERAGFA